MALDHASSTRTSFVTAPAAFRSKEPVSHHASMELAPPDVLQGWTVLILNNSDSETVMLRAWIASLGGLAVRISDVPEGLAYIRRNPHAQVALVLEVTSEDLETRIDECFDIRRMFPDRPIILISSTFGRNDFSTERMAVCDASLRSPVSQVAFKLAVPAALSNNEFFVSRTAKVGTERKSTIEKRPATVAVGRDVSPGNMGKPTVPAAHGATVLWGGRFKDVCLSCGIGLALSVCVVLMFSV